MMAFSDYLSQRLERGGFSTEDALASFLPLMRQVAAVHRAGMVAPLQGVHAIRVDSNRLWFEEAHVVKPALASAAIRALERPAAGAVDVVGQYRVDMQVEQGNDAVVSSQIGRRGEPITHPVYLPGYVCWEHEVGQHDPLTDIFVLGMILAALAASLDLGDPEELATFVQRRRNLFELNPNLHPVLAKAITRMTELDRHRRPQDSTSLLRSLENYRDQGIDLDIDLARTMKFQSADRVGKRELILSALQQRLFEISRRNRLLHFRATTQTVNLTWASVPLSFDVQNIRGEHLLTWGHAFKDAITAGADVNLNKYLRFEEALYLPGQLDAIRNEARRDQTEFGFAQLRLVVCFLRWANLKEKPPERYDSPLILLPVRLTKTKGVRDVYTLEPIGTEAEVNPVLRYYLKQLYAVELPEFVDLAEASLDDLHAFIAGKVQASEPAVTIEKIDKPRVNLIHARAQRRLEQYRRRARLSGRGVRSFLDIDYSYNRDNYHPLGLRIFQTRIAAAEPRLRTLVEETPRPRTQMAPVTPETSDGVERLLYSQVEDETNPYRWEFDLCNVTLGNFHYRKMSLVRDYAVLLEQAQEHGGFDKIFSLEPREAPQAAPAPLPLEESYPIVHCDPTQASAIALARTGKHFIIQGPPGTGKSQTITNLIADFVAEGKRVLFVCEKRAAIDVVYHRLKQTGLHELCCLIHDAQDDKKEFIFDLKATYEAFLGEKDGRASPAEKERQALLGKLKGELAPLERYDAVMCSTPPQAGLPVHRLLDRVVELHDHAPTLSPREQEALPSFHLWRGHAEAIDRLRGQIEAIRPDGVLAAHPLRRLHGRFGQIDRPLEAIHAGLASVEDRVRTLHDKLRALDMPGDCWETLERLQQLIDHARSLSFLAEHDLLGVLTAKSALANRLAAHRKKLSAKEQELKRARIAANGWRHKLSPEDTAAALEQMRQQESALTRFFAPSWWRLRGLLQRSYDFTAHRVQPTYTHVLGLLQREHFLRAELDQLESEARAEFSFASSFAAFSEQVAGLTNIVDGLPTFLRGFHGHVLQAPTGNETVQSLAGLHARLVRMLEALSSLFAEAKQLSLTQVRNEVAQVQEALGELPGFVPCLKELAALPAALSDAWRRFPLTANQLESAIAGHTIQDLLRADPSLARFTSSVRAAHLTRLEKLHDQWHAAGAQTVRERACRRFVERVHLSSLPHAQLTPEQKEFKLLYNRGRRELEHEFNKTMRFRSIRDLVSGDSGLVLQDLKPVWLMSPLSISDALPLTKWFDVVIFDEASQVTLEEAVPALFRAGQVLVVGDEMQLPPTSFFAAKHDDEEGRLLFEDASGQEVEYELSNNSFLNHAARNLPSTMLGWHYRSRSESLISFSNAAFYQGRLLTVPEVALSQVAAPTSAGASSADLLLERPVSFHFLEKGVYEQRRNTAEADLIASLVRGVLEKKNGMSIGIIAFSEAQQAEIEQALDRLARDDDAFRAALEIEWEREQDGQFVGLLVKNLENIQGDERDIVILSVCYGPGPGGKMLMNFGPINQNGGERRLNVAFSRAKKHMAVVSSIRHEAITNDYNDGARALKNYLRYADALSRGDGPAAARVLAEINPTHAAERAAAPANVVCAQIAELLRQRGFEVATDVGQSGFRCDLAVRRPSESRYRLGILVDSDRYYQNRNLLERDLLRPQLLRNFGWNVMPILTKDWLDNRAAVLASIDQRLASKG